MQISLIVSQGLAIAYKLIRVPVDEISQVIEFKVF